MSRPSRPRELSFAYLGLVLALLAIVLDGTQVAIGIATLDPGKATYAGESPVRQDPRVTPSAETTSNGSSYMFICADGNKKFEPEGTGFSRPLIDMAGADLSGANLEGLDLSHTDLTCANLTGANLKGATLSLHLIWGACLEGADLSGATTLSDQEWV